MAMGSPLIAPRSQSNKSPDRLQRILSPDLILRIAESLVESNPKSILSLLLTSKTIHSLLRTYERSITRTVSLRDSSLTYLNLPETPEILSTLMWPGNFQVTRFSYPWLVEIQCRQKTIDYLLNHNLTDMSNDACNWPTLDVKKDQLKQRLQLLKRRAFLLLYRLSDCAAKLCGPRDVRQSQAEFLEDLPVADLAALGCIVEVIGQGYFSTMKNALAALEYKDSLLGLRPSKRPREIFIPNSVQNTGDLESDYWIRECMCVFEDRIQRYGPYFAWSFFEGHSIYQRPDQWTRDDLQEGIDDMNAFELGHTMSYASLQSVVWKVFCTKAKCARADSWAEAKRYVEAEMAEYKLD